MAAAFPKKKCGTFLKISSYPIYRSNPNILQVFSVPLAPWASALSFCWQTTPSLSFTPWVLLSVQPTRSTRMP